MLYCTVHFQPFSPLSTTGVGSKMSRNEIDSGELQLKKRKICIKRESNSRRVESYLATTQVTTTPLMLVLEKPQGYLCNSVFRSWYYLGRFQYTLFSHYMESSSSATPSTPTSNDHLYYPTLETGQSADLKPEERLIQSDKLYVGNLSSEISL